ncbi:thiol-disulfide oxidoreductase ResA [Sporosarcina sp. 179-K 3D1 HS]|uniref:thiol-disulfide oxidoreductase ResA n=1 Tax=Sporosarcina sp. 179-K 3D1 HS TaxID=3232169 RepID=UPI0039A093ED
MDKKRKRLIIRTIVLLTLVAAVIYSIASKEKVEVLVVGDKAPDFELVDLDGNKHRLSDYKGQGVFLNFWGTWCPPCKEEMPYMEKQYQVFKDKGVQILAVDIAEPQLKVESFRDQYGLTFPIVIDKNKSVMETYNIGPLPTTVLIDPDGKIVHVEKRGMSEEVIKSFMERIQPK